MSAYHDRDWNQDEQPSKQEQTNAMLCHLSAVLGLLIPPANIIAPIVIWIVKKDESQFVDEQGREAVNFQISLVIYSLACVVLFFTVIGIFVAIPLMFAIGILGIVLPIIAALKANEGRPYRYPFAIRFL